MWVMSEGIEMFGALGYLEDSTIPRLARDAQVTPIWEGTTNTLVHDFLFTLAKDKINLANQLKIYLINLQCKDKKFLD